MHINSSLNMVEGLFKLTIEEAKGLSEEESAQRFDEKLGLKYELDNYPGLIGAALAYWNLYETATRRAAMTLESKSDDVETIIKEQKKKFIEELAKPEIPASSLKVRLIQIARLN